MQGGSFQLARANTGNHASVTISRLHHKTTLRHHCGDDSINKGKA